MPILTPRLRRSRREGYEAAGNLLTITVLVCAAVAVLWIGATFTPLMGFLWDGPAAEAAQLGAYMRMMALTLPVIGAAYLLVALMQSLEHFVLQGSMSIPYNLALILFLAVFAGRLGVGGYVAAVTAAWLLQLGMTVPYMIKEQYRPRFRLDLRADYVKTFFRTALVTVLTTSIFLFCYLQDSGMTARLDGSPVSAFYYADKLFTPLTTTLIYSISTVLFPKFSQEYANTDQATYRRYIWGVLRSTLAIILPMSMVLAAFGLYLYRKNPTRALKTAVPVASNYWSDFATGFLLTFSNPLILFFIIGLFARFNFILPEFEIHHHIIAYTTIFGGALLWWYGVTSLVSHLGKRINVRSLKLINRIIALVLMGMAVLGVVMALLDKHF